MKAQMLKMSGCKNEKEFYSKFPDEESFMKVHGKQFKKAILGANIAKAPNGIKQPYGFNPDYMNEDSIYPDSKQPNNGGIDYTFGQFTNTPGQLGYNVSGDPNGQQFNISGQPINGQSVQQSISNPDMKSIEGKGSNLANFIEPAGKLIGGIQALSAEKEKLQGVRQMRGVSDVMRKASGTRPEQIARRYVRPEDMVIQPNQLNNPYGTNTNVLDKGGVVPKAANGFNNFMSGGGSEFVDNMESRVFNNNAGYQIGSAVGDAVKFIPGVGPVVGAIAKPILGAIGGIIDNNGKKIKNEEDATQNNINSMSFNNNMQGLQRQNTSYMEDGGTAPKEFNTTKSIIVGYNKDTNEPIFDVAWTRNANRLTPIKYSTSKGIVSDPSKIEWLGEYYKNDAMKDSINTSKSISKYKMENGGTMNGDLRVGKGGYAEPISYNPYLPDDGETVMFRGKDHSEGGIDVAYGRNPVEVESGEPAVKLEDGGGSDNLVVFGNLPINRNYANVLGDPNAKGKKFKNYIADLSKVEDKQNKTIKSSTEKVGALDVVTPFDRLSFNSHKANIMGADMKLKEIADKKTKASALQEAINSTAEQYGIVADDFARGKIKKAKKGITIGKTDTSSKEKFPWIQAINSVVPYFRPTNATPLDNNQLLGEQYAMATNQLEPVQAQTYNPQLDTPYNVSLQDIRNENQADYRSAEKLVGGNPAALAILNAQKYSANQKVGAEEFRMNQAEKDKVYSGNRAILNDAQLKNLGIYDRQYERQEQANTNTKGITQAALNSISDKRLKNQLENRTLQTYENLYNYRYDAQGRAINMNPLAEFNIPTVGSSNQSGIIKNNSGEDLLPVYGKDGDITGYRVKQEAKTKTTKSRNGSIVQAIKNL